MTITIEINPSWHCDGKERFNRDHAIAEMLARQAILIMPASGRAGKPAEIWINCNDLFAWGSADAEPLPYSEIESAYRAYKSGKHGLDKWACQRRGVRPEGAAIEAMKADGAWDDAMEALPESSVDG